MESPASPEEKARLGKLAPEAVRAGNLAGEPITAKLTGPRATMSPIGGLKVTAAQGWLAAGPRAPKTSIRSTPNVKRTWRRSSPRPRRSSSARMGIRPQPVCDYPAPRPFLACPTQIASTGKGVPESSRYLREICKMPSKAIKLDDEMYCIKALADSAAHAEMKEAIRQFLEREEESEQLRRETLERWERFERETVSHESVEAWPFKPGDYLDGLRASAQSPEMVARSIADLARLANLSGPTIRKTGTTAKKILESVRI